MAKEGAGGVLAAGERPPPQCIPPHGFFFKMPTEPNISGEIIERVFAAGLGLPHRRVATWRKEHLEKGADWRYEKEVILTATGKAKAEKWFQVGNGAAVNDPGVQVGVVGRFNFRNQKLILREDGKTAISVRTNENFRPGMSVKFRNEGGRLVLVGRCPRWPGRY